MNERRILASIEAKEQRKQFKIYKKEEKKQNKIAAKMQHKVEKEEKRERKKTVNKETRRRLFFLMACFFAVLLGLSGRLAYIQIYDADRYQEAYIRQNQVVLEGIDRRGMIYDKKMNPLLRTEEAFICFVPKDSEEAKNALDGIEVKKLNSQNKKYDIYSASTENQSITRELEEKYEAFVFKIYRRYAKEQLAVHLIGHINSADNKGNSGLEKSFDDLLCAKTKSLYATVDNTGTILRGLGVRASETVIENGIVTTLDLEVQKVVEDVMNDAVLDNGENTYGAAVVLEVSTGNVIASVSTPGYDPSRVQDYLNSSNQEFINKAVQAEYPPGSIFKIIVAAAALESGKFSLKNTFHCQGYEEINGVKIACSNKSGHGDLTFIDAFAKSCNCAYIQIGQELGGEAIIAMSEKFGIGRKALTCISEEKSGLIPTLGDTMGAGIGNISIGQGKLLMTPIQAARMTNIIASGGIDPGVHLVTQRMENGKMIQYENEIAQRTVISKETADIISKMMEETMVSGTGNNIDLSKVSSSAGKTGSAQAAHNGKMTAHAWFTGYFPADSPKYVIAVIVEEGNSGRGIAVPIFQEIAARLN